MKKKITMEGRPKKASQVAVEALANKKNLKVNNVKEGVDLAGLASELTRRRAENIEKESEKD